MSFTYLLLDAAAWTWIVVVAGLMIGGYVALDRLMRKGMGNRGSGGMGAGQAVLSQSCKLWLIPHDDSDRGKTGPQTR